MTFHASLRTKIPLATLALLVALAGPVTAQTSELSTEVGASRVLPPTGVDGDAAGFFVAGLRGSRYGFGGNSVYASLLFGRALDNETGGDFVSAEVGGALWHGLAPGWTAGLEGRAFGFRVANPFPYMAGAMEGSATLRYRGEVLSARLAGTGGVGQSRVTLTEVVQRMRRQATVTEILEDNLWRIGSTVEVLAGGGALSAGVAGGIHRSSGGTYSSAGVRVLLAGQLGALELRADAWRTPVGDEPTGGIAFYIPWGGWTARGIAGKPEPDPLLLAEPGRGAGGVLLGRRILGRGPVTLSAVAPLYQVVETTAAGARVRLTVRAPDGATAVSVLGDFTLWEEVAMTATGGRWTVEMVVPAGTHHFGFLVDGAWYLPDDAPDAVPDEWGRSSATLIIEGEAGSGASGPLDPQGVGEP